MALIRRSLGFYFCGSKPRLLLTISILFMIFYFYIINNSTPPSNTNYATKLSLELSASTIQEDNAKKIEKLLTMKVYDEYDNTTGFTEAIEPLIDNLPLCPGLDNITDYNKKVPQAILLIEDLQESELEAVHTEIKPGGSWRPDDCKALHKVAVIIPYRDRKSHLTRLLDFLYPIMQKQRLDFRFIVTEQYGDDLFNKGRIMNAAFKFAEKLNVDCVIFHDVDMFPQDDRTPYNCPDTPRHLGAFVSNLGYQLWYKELVGGALSMRMEDYLAVNGYSNLYWAWGGEDDDMGSRILSLNLTIERPEQEYARYSMLKHVKRKHTAPKLIYKLLDSAATRWKTDGVNDTGLWSIKSVRKRPLYYHLLVDVGTPPPEWRGS